jgi:hypothetical protein
MGTRDKKQSLVLLFIFLCKANTLALLIGITLFELKFFLHSEKTPSHASLIPTSPQSQDIANMGDEATRSCQGNDSSSTSKATTTKNWFANCSMKKNMLPLKLYTLENGVAHSSLAVTVTVADYLF